MELGIQTLILLAGNFVLYWIVNTMVEVSMNKKDSELDELERLLTKEEFDKILDKFESDFEKEFGNALHKNTETVQKRVSAAAIPRRA